MNQDQWESICRKCGKCCYEKVDVGAGEIHYTDEPCQYLDVETHQCKVYHDRHEVEPDCISLTEHLVRTLNWLPKNCAYLAYIRHIDTLAEVRKATDRKKRNCNTKRRR